MSYAVCGSCAARIPPANWNQDFPVPCPVCAADVSVTVFPAALHPPQAVLPEQIVTGQEAGCYNHAAHRAVAACDSCGRFLCSLCDIDTAPGHICPACFDRLDASALRERVNYDSIALALVTLPMLLCWLPIVTTPAALFFTFKFWDHPSSLFPRSRWRLQLTIAIAILQVAAFAWLLTFLPAFGGGAR